MTAEGEWAETTDVTAEREFARHLAYRMLDRVSDMLVEGRAGTLRVGRIPDPRFSAVAGQSLRVIAEAVRRDVIPERFVRQVTQDLASSDAGTKNGPEAEDFEAII